MVICPILIYLLNNNTFFCFNFHLSCLIPVINKTQRGMGILGVRGWIRGRVGVVSWPSPRKSALIGRTIINQTQLCKSTGYINETQYLKLVQMGLQISVNCHLSYFFIFVQLFKFVSFSTHSHLENLNFLLKHLYNYKLFIFYNIIDSQRVE